MATPRTSRAPSPATRPWARSCAPRWPRAAAPISSSSRAPTRARCTASTRRCAAPKSISRPAPTGCSSRRRKRSTSSPRSGGRFKACRSSRTWWKAAGARRCCRRASSTAWASPWWRIRPRSSSASRARSRARSPTSRPASPRARTKASTSRPSRTSPRSPIGPRWSNAPRIRENDDDGGDQRLAGGRGRAARRHRLRRRARGEAGIVAGAARRRRQARAVLSAADGDGAARLLPRRRACSADVVTGAFDHTIQMQAKGQPIVAVVQLGQFPGYVLGVLTKKAQGYRSPADLKGMKIGVTAPGSSTHFMVQHLMVTHGLKRDDASFVGIGASASAVAAVQRGEIDAIVNVDPVINLLESQGLIKVMADTRTLAGTRDVFGGAYPAAVLYAPRAFIAEKPRTTQALVNALVRALKWIGGRSAEEVAAVMPPDYALGNAALYRQSIETSLPMYVCRQSISGSWPGNLRECLAHLV